MTPTGRIFVAQLSSGVIAEVVHGLPRPVLYLPGVVGLEDANGGATRRRRPW